MQVLFIGDVVGGPGRRGCATRCRRCGSATAPDLVVVNGENSAGGMGITEKTASDLFDAGADVITSGNHVYRHREVYDFLDRERPRDPAGQLPARQPRPGLHRGRGRRQPGRGDQPQRRGSGLKVARSPFHEVDSILEQIEADCVDRRLPRRGDQREGGDGLAPRRAGRGGLRNPHPRADRRRAGAAQGHRVHLRRRDDRARGPACSGSSRSRSLERLITQMPVQFETADEDVWVMGAVVEVNDRGWPTRSSR